MSLAGLDEWCACYYKQLAGSDGLWYNRPHTMTLSVCSLEMGPESWYAHNGFPTESARGVFFWVDPGSALPLHQGLFDGLQQEHKLVRTKGIKYL